MSHAYLYGNVVISHLVIVTDFTEYWSFLCVFSRMYISMISVCLRYRFVR